MVGSIILSIVIGNKEKYYFIDTHKTLLKPLKKIIQINTKINLLYSKKNERNIIKTMFRHIKNRKY